MFTSCLSQLRREQRRLLCSVRCLSGQKDDSYQADHELGALRQRTLQGSNSLTLQVIQGTILVLLSITGIQAGSQAVALPTANSKPTNLRMFVDPSSTSLALGRASLTVSPLTYQKQTYAGDYQLKVVPFLYKSQAGKLSLAAPDDSVRRLAEGLAVEFTGEAVNQKDGKTKVVKGKITPITKDRGTVAFKIATENGELVFNTSYHFAP